MTTLEVAQKTIWNLRYDRDRALLELHEALGTCAEQLTQYDTIMVLIKAIERAQDALNSGFDNP